MEDNQYSLAYYMVRFQNSVGLRISFSYYLGVNSEFHRAVAKKDFRFVQTKCYRFSVF